MKFFSKDSSNEFDGTASLTKAEKRVRSLSTTEILNWADMAGSVVADNFAQARKQESPLPELLEARQGLEALTVVVEELIRRQPLTPEPATDRFVLPHQQGASPYGRDRSNFR
jgi:hypothetical protein